MENQNKEEDWKEEFDLLASKPGKEGFISEWNRQAVKSFIEKLILKEREKLESIYGFSVADWEEKKKQIIKEALEEQKEKILKEIYNMNNDVINFYEQATGEMITIEDELYIIQEKFITKIKQL